MSGSDSSAVAAANGPVQDPGDLRPGEEIVDLPAHHDAGLYFIGRIRTPWPARSACPRQGDIAHGPLCRIAVDGRWARALTGIGRHSHLQVLYWMDQARRDAVLLSPRGAAAPSGALALRAPLRPNPIASSTVALVDVDGYVLTVRGLDCVDGTPLLDIKPVRCPMASEEPITT
ncbi:SAM-dependent methyltransferase [Chelatococcus reniformis]|uniref:tRNA (N6-threonylcarbamoyladenosine(37)-N6)-methyltransferase TrmO n=1 Tax=Chelatococcus reniformis TaxID=1494448 RepID=A0A916TZL2_9HYPH|nr:SAM-dependent methyltransferase [Chelatococcus reniformis]GGC51972.1 tRNA (N6-threonylcarbamoyladenosine(37)-N6)-methyltransferase TrmO [Chelatococcus reniformis]